MLSLLSTLRGRNEATAEKTKATPARRRRGILLLGRLDLVTARHLVQLMLSAFLLYAGWRFYWFVRHFETGGATPYVERPAAAEAFLPISALVSLRAWLGTGVYDTIHPAGLAILLAILLSSLLWKKGFCSWLCPIGTLSEIAGRLGQRVFGRNFVLPAGLDWTLMGIKYLLLLFFAKAIFLDWDVRATMAFINGPYNRIADVKMLYFFTQLTLTGFLILAGLWLLSMLISNFWCRYLCPYGALLGLASLLSPVNVRRDEKRCIDCGRCTRVCPNGIDVATATVVRSPECTSCLNCLNVCPRRGALDLAVPTGRFRLHPWAYPVLLLGTFFLVLAIAQISGHWQTSVSYAEYAKFIPQAGWLSH